jgi:hypothetical protein
MAHVGCLNPDGRLYSRNQMNKGGMSKRPFADRERLDKLDLRTFRSSRDAPEKVLFQHTILDAANNYLFFGLVPKNRCTVSEFWYAYEYFYRIRSYDRLTWADANILKVTAIDETINKRVTTTTTLSDLQMQAMCFDTHYTLANIQMPIETFLTGLRRERRIIIEENWNQINKQLKQLNQNNPNHGIIKPLKISERKRILLSPESPNELAQLVNLGAAEDKKKMGFNGNHKDVGNLGFGSSS